MRLLIACPKCHRQYDAGARPVGSMFRCHCGAAVTVRQPKGHDAEVVRCSSCGAPRQEGRASCSFCGSDFTLHEQDLDTICPKCFARVSNRAKFCHHCGLRISPEVLVGEKTELFCPVCGKTSRLDSRQVGDVALMECGRCAGFWLGASVLDRLVEKSRSDLSIEDFQLQSVPRRAATLEAASHRGPMYRKCPICGRLMNRRNFARHSGVIIDTCREHGVWFDPDELTRILVWVRQGHKAEADRQAAREAEHQKRLDSIARMAELQREARKYRSYPLGGGPHSASVLGDIVAWLFR